jgi:hypothetical protein
MDQNQNQPVNKKKQSQRRNCNGNQKPKLSPKQKRNVVKNSTGPGSGVSFNIRKNKVDKFYCPNLPSTSTKSGPTGSVEIQDLPEIPLDSLFGTQ